MAGTHARKAPSAAKRWMNCPGSIAASDGIPERSSVFADEGTAAHALAEHCGVHGYNADRFVEQWIDLDGKLYDDRPDDVDGVYEVTEEMVWSVQLYLDTVRHSVKPGDDFGFEAKVHLNDEIHGTTDGWAYDPKTQHLAVFDLKYGRGVLVEVADNPQAIIYAIGKARALQNRGIRTVEIVIVQPRAKHADGPVRRATYDAGQLLDWWADIEAAAAACDEPDAPRKAGDWCKFCPVEGVCPARKSYALDAARLEFMEGELTDPTTYDPTELAETLSKLDRLEGWAKAVRDFALAEAKDRRVPPGWKLVPTRATRKWKNPDEAVEFLTDIYGMDKADVYLSKLKSPAQVEKVIGKKNVKDIAGLYEHKSSGVVLAPLDDPRPTVADAASEFID